MGRMNTKPKSKQGRKLPMLINSPGVPGERTARPDAAVDAPDYRFIIWASVAGIAATLLCMVVFFQSDIPSKIVVAKAANAAQMQPAVKDKADAPPADGSLQPGDSGQNEPSVGTGDAGTPVAGADGKDGKDGKDGAPGASGIVIAPGAVVDSSQLSGYLSEMEPADFTALAESVDMLIADNPEMVNLPKRKSLAEAYAEAEAKYPGQIDGSKRLKLVDELNAIDYLYYVAEDGDTLLELSKSFGIPLGQLVEINGIPEADKIKAGAILLLPSETVQPE